MNWNNIREKVTIAVLTGIVLGGLAWLATKFMTPDPQIITAESRWIDLPNPTRGLRFDKAADELEKTVGALFGVSGEALRNLRHSGSLRIGSLRFQNNSQIRSKEVEVSIENSALFSSEATQSTDFGSSLTLKPLPPEGTATVYFIAQPWFSIFGTTVLSIHDNRNVEVVSKSDQGGSQFVVDFVEQHTFIAYLLMLAGTGTLLVLLTSIATNMARRLISEVDRDKP